MTTYKYEVSLNDREMAVVSEVFKRHIALCQEPAKDSPESSYHIATLENVMRRLIDGAAMTSTNNFFDKTRR